MAGMMTGVQGKAILHKLRVPSFYANVSWKILRGVILFGLCFFIIYPFITKLTDMFKSVEDLFNPTIRYIPMHPSTEYLQRILGDMKYFPTLLRTVVYCTSVAVLQTAVAALTAYGLARFRFRGNGLIFALAIFTLLVPPQTLMIPLYVNFRFFLGFINLINTPGPSLVLSATGLYLKSGLYIFMFRQFFRNIPKDLEEASYIDGNNTLQTFTKIIIPTSVTMITTIFLLAFCWQWTDTVFTVFWPNAQMMASKVGSTQARSWDAWVEIDMLRNASAALAVLPLGVLYIFAQNLFTRSIARTGITG